MRHNDICGLAETYLVALRDAPGDLTMTSDRGGKNHVVADKWDGPTVTVPVMTLDAVLSGESCKLIKLDAEGFEYNILKGATEMLSNSDLSALIVELNGSGTAFGVTDEDVHKEILSFGFLPYSYSPMKREMTKLATFNREAFNTLYVHDAEKVEPLLKMAPFVTVGGGDL
jgi:hypothetical protein